MKHKQPESVADFKARIAKIVREQQGDNPAIGKPVRDNPCVWKGPKTYGYNHWEKPR